MDLKLRIEELNENLEEANAHLDDLKKDIKKMTANLSRILEKGTPLRPVDNRVEKYELSARSKRQTSKSYSNDDFEKFSFLKIRHSVDKEIEKFFISKIQGSTGTVKEILNSLREFTLRGGKRIRPLFMILGYWLNSDIDEEIVKASISLEFMQSYLLIHDDIIDQSEIRRGSPAFHKIFGFGERTNESIALVSADLCNEYSREALLNAQYPLERLTKAMVYMSELVEYTNVGQLMDMTLLLGDKTRLEDITQVYNYKTAQYTVNGPMKIGAILSGYPNPEEIDEYGLPLGIAFQIQDDILGVFGDEKTLGKSVKSDF